MQRSFINVRPKELELLFCVCKLPKSYIKIRKKLLIEEYSPHFLSMQAYEAFMVFMDEFNIDSISDMGKACYKHFIEKGRM